MNELFKKAIKRFEKEHPNCEIVKMSMLENSHCNGEMVDAMFSVQYCDSEALANDGIIETKTTEIVVSIND